MDVKKEKRKIKKQVIADMVALGTYRKEFDVAIDRYIDMRIQFDLLNERWYDEGCQFTEPYTNKAGATNERKTALYLAIEKLRDELAKTEGLFGLNPKGLKEIKKKGLEQRTASALDRLLSG